MCLAQQFKGFQSFEIPSHLVEKRYGNHHGSYILLIDGSKLWIDPNDGECLWVID